MTIAKATTDLASAPAPQYPPSLFPIAGEARAALDFMSLPLSLVQSKLASNEGAGSRPIIMLPGFASDERWLKPLELFLRNLGYTTEDWGLGKNLAGINLPHTLDDLSDTWEFEPYHGQEENYRGEAGVPYLCDQAIARVRERSLALVSPVTLVGWSLGGFIAREVARELPREVAQVITLGAPVIGGPKYSKAASYFESRKFNIDWIEQHVAKRDARPIQQPITVIYSKSDAIVDWRAAMDKVSPNARHYQVKASHIGMGFNRSIFSIIRHSLRKHR